MIQIYFQSLLIIVSLMTILWIVSILLKNVSIVDMFWGFGFVIVNVFFFLMTSPETPCKILLLILVTIWGLRLSVYLAWRNIGKGEDFRYQEFRRKYGENRYWWISFFQTFLLQGVLMWIISMPLLGVHFLSKTDNLGFLDIIGMVIWLIGFIFESGGDYQLAKFKMNIENKGRVLNSGFWHYTRHPNYFGDAAVWWSYSIFCISAGSYWLIAGSVIMTLLIINVSGVSLLEKTLKDQKPEYIEYIRSTSSFIPWLTKKKRE